MTLWWSMRTEGQFNRAGIARRGEDRAQVAWLDGDVLGYVITAVCAGTR